ncbi:MAG: hypothetical protein WCD04_16440 [Terriglobia bacterium]
MKLKVRGIHLEIWTQSRINLTFGTTGNFLCHVVTGVDRVFPPAPDV